MLNDTKQSSINVLVYGYGNVAAALVDAFSAVKSLKLSVSGRDSSKLNQFAEKHSVSIATEDEISAAEIVLIAVKDDAIQSVYQQLSATTTGILAHTSGTIGIDVFEDAACFYPLQTFNGINQPDFSKIPLLISAESAQVEAKLMSLGRLVSQTVQTIHPDAKKNLHLAAVLASNFINTLLDESEKILQKSDLSLELLNPLVHQVVENAFSLSPYKAQTGPARRHDLGVIQQHLKMLDENPKMAEIYSLLSNLIIEKYPK